MIPSAISVQIALQIMRLFTPRDFEAQQQRELKALQSFPILECKHLPKLLEESSFHGDDLQHGVIIS